jgi:hypothetical protein
MLARPGPSPALAAKVAAWRHRLAASAAALPGAGAAPGQKSRRLAARAAAGGGSTRGADAGGALDPPPPEGIVRSSSRPRSERLGALHAAVVAALNNKRGRGRPRKAAQPPVAAPVVPQPPSEPAQPAPAGQGKGRADKRTRPAKARRASTAAEGTDADVPAAAAARTGRRGGGRAAVAAAGVSAAAPRATEAAAQGAGEEAGAAPAQAADVAGAPLHESKEERAERRAQLRVARSLALGPAVAPGGADGADGEGGGGADGGVTGAAAAPRLAGAHEEDPGAHGAEPTPLAPPEWSVHPEVGQASARSGGGMPGLRGLRGRGRLFSRVSFVVAERRASTDWRTRSKPALAARRTTSFPWHSTQHARRPAPPPSRCRQVKEARAASEAAKAMRWWAAKRGEVLGVLLPSLQDARVLAANDAATRVKLAVALAAVAGLSSAELQTAAAAARKLALDGGGGGGSGATQAGGGSGVGGSAGGDECVHWWLFNFALRHARDDEARRRRVMFMLPLALANSPEQIDARYASSARSAADFERLAAAYPALWQRAVEAERARQVAMLEREWEEEPDDPGLSWDEAAGTAAGGSRGGGAGSGGGGGAMGMLDQLLAALGGFAAGGGSGGGGGGGAPATAAAAAAAAAAQLQEIGGGNAAAGEGGGGGAVAGVDGAVATPLTAPSREPSAIAHLASLVRAAAETAAAAAAPGGGGAATLLERCVALCLALTCHEPRDYMRQYLPIVAASAADAAGSAPPLDPAIIRIVAAAEAAAAAAAGAEVLQDELRGVVLALSVGAGVLSQVAAHLEAMSSAEAGLAAAVAEARAARGALVAALGDGGGGSSSGESSAAD